MIYSPSEDSYLLAGQVNDLANGKRVLDMGSGSGIQGRIALDAGAKSVVCVEQDSESVSHLRKEGFNVVKSDLFEKVSGRFDLIVFNPPYLPSDSREDRESSKVTSGGFKGDEVLIRFLRKVRDYLSGDGKALIVVSSLTPREKIEEILLSEGLEWEVVVWKKVFMEKLEVWRIS
jgi:release factor glutamine methyltransferase